MKGFACHSKKGILASEWLQVWGSRMSHPMMCPVDVDHFKLKASLAAGLGETSDPYP